MFSPILIRITARIIARITASALFATLLAACGGAPAAPAPTPAATAIANAAATSAVQVVDLGVLNAADAQEYLVDLPDGWQFAGGITNGLVAAAPSVIPITPNQTVEATVQALAGGEVQTRMVGDKTVYIGRGGSVLFYALSADALVQFNVVELDTAPLSDALDTLTAIIVTVRAKP
jgi:hypothetical protein